jgi:serine/threonine protein kinase
MKNIGTIGYRAPEIEEDRDYDPRLADIWSLGAILMTTATRTLPFYTDSSANDRIYKLMCAKQPEDRQKYFGVYKRVKVLPKAFEELILGMMAYDVTERWSIQKIKESEFYRESLITDEKAGSMLNELLRAQ